MPSDLCFVLMPFDKKPDVSGKLVDFDAVYRDLIAPAIRDAGLDPIRADEEMTGGIIHKPMFERLIFCKFAVADLTTANANVFYELGVRHSVRPWSTVLIYSKGGSQLPFDVAPLRAMPYTLAPDGTPADVEATRAALAKRLVAAREAATRELEKEPEKDSPVYELVENYPDVDHTKTDEFRTRVDYSAEQKKKLGAARQRGQEALRAAEREMGDFRLVESGVLVDLFLSYRAVKAWNDMIGLAARMPRELAATVLVQEQLALALNRAGRGDEAEQVLEDLIASRGPSSETYGILGRVYKDRWKAAARDGKAMLARGLLDKAIGAYLQGFEADWRDAYPGVNAVSLMEIKDPRHPGRQEIFPVVSYAVERKIAAGKADYWDYATRLELAVVDQDEEKATQALSDALANVREEWEPETTVDNLSLIRAARQGRGEEVAWAKEAEDALAAWRKPDAP